MKTKLLIVTLIAFAIIACNKGQFTSKPQLSFKSINSLTFSQGQVLNFQINFTDAEGDIQDTMWIQKVSKTCPSSPGTNFAVKYKVPDFPTTKNLSGYFDINFAYNTTSTGYVSITGCGTINDSSYFRFVLKDKANNVSDTLVSPVITLLK
ncbi:MAG: hypothetical protein JSR09_00410 [Bacteroidetes bacterium]|nr:hypothetical protein [Bacteroidota bacterium]MBS1648146.1 hypothetical protein [Bacteroidota bacterium]